MTVKVTKPAVNLREELASLNKPSGIVGESILRADTAADAVEQLNLEDHTFTTFTSTGIDDNATSTALTLDSSGNLLVGKSVTDIGTVGFRVDGSNGFATITRDSYEPLILNRKTLDGDIAVFKKDGATVGSIGSEGGDALYIQSGTTSGTGLLFTGNGTTIRPARNGVTIHNTLDLGSDTRSFKDLYLSGGVVFGDAGGSGTPTSNLLDDYEEGSFTPIITDDSGRAGTHAIQVGRYVKVGKLVHIQGRVELSSLASMNGLVNLTGFPFANINVANAYSSVNVSFADGLAITAGENLSATIVPNTSNAQMRLWDDAVGTTSLTTGELSSNGGFMFAATYIST